MQTGYAEVTSLAHNILQNQERISEFLISGRNIHHAVRERLNRRDLRSDKITLATYRQGDQLILVVRKKDIP